MSGVREATFPGTEGEIFYRTWRPDGPPCRIVLIVHGYAEHGGRYGHVADRLCAAGAVVYAPDHIGHGRSEGEPALITDFEHVVDDLHTLGGLARAEHGPLPLVLVGHSMGGLLASRFAQRFPEEPAGLALLGAVIGDWMWARNVLALPQLPSEPSDPMLMSRDPEAGRAYADDPLVYHGGYKRRLLEAEVAALDRFQAGIERLQMPVLFLHGDEDPFVPYRTSLEALRRMPARDKTIHIYPGARHELVNETNRDEVITDLAAFVERVAP